MTPVILASQAAPPLQPTPPKSFAEVMQSDRECFNRFFHEMLKRGVYLAPSAYEAGFVSAAHMQEDIDETLTAARASFAEIMK